LPDSENKVEEAWNYLEERFGVTREKLEGYRLKFKSGDIWLVSKDMETDLDVETYGFRFLRFTGKGLKPTTYGLQVLGRKLEKNVVEVDKEELEGLLKRERMVDRDLEENGYVAIRYDGRIIGCGFYAKDKVSSRIPKGRGKELLDIF